MRKPYYSFLLRLWKPGETQTAHWNVSLEDPHSHELVSFSSLEACFDYLRQLSGATNRPPESPGNTKRNRLPD